MGTKYHIAYGYFDQATYLLGTQLTTPNYVVTLLGDSK
jgi:hypothetical protein